MTWMPASTWTPPAATSSSPSSSSSRRSLAAWNGASPSWRTKPNRAAHRGPGLKPRSSPKSPAPQQWKPRPHGFSRRRIGARGGELPRLRDPVAAGPIAPGRSSTCPGSPRKSDVFIARVCPRCRRNCLPQAELDGAALGKQRLGVNLVSLTPPCGKGRLPIRNQWYLQLRLMGAIVAASRNRPGPRCRAQRIRGSPVVHADETGGGRTAPTAMTFSILLRRGRGKSVVDEVLGEGSRGCWSAISTPPTTITTAPNSGAGLTC